MSSGNQNIQEWNPGINESLLGLINIANCYSRLSGDNLEFNSLFIAKLFMGNILLLRNLYFVNRSLIAPNSKFLDTVMSVYNIKKKPISYLLHVNSVTKHWS